MIEGGSIDSSRTGKKCDRCESECRPKNHSWQQLERIEEKHQKFEGCATENKSSSRTGGKWHRCESKCSPKKHSCQRFECTEKKQKKFEGSSTDSSTNEKRLSIVDYYYLFYYLIWDIIVVYLKKKIKVFSPAENYDINIIFNEKKICASVFFFIINCCVL